MPVGWKAEILTASENINERTPVLTLNVKLLKIGSVVSGITDAALKALSDSKGTRSSLDYISESSSANGHEGVIPHCAQINFYFDAIEVCVGEVDNYNIVI